MIHTKGTDVQILFARKLKGLRILGQFLADNFKRKLRCNDAKTLDDPGEALRADNHHRLSPVTVSHRKKHPGKPRDVIRMKMSDQNERNRIRTPALFLQCNLRALTAVEKNALPVITNQQ